jgi:hypothetical protein
MESCQARHQRGYGKLYHLVSHYLDSIVVVYRLASFFPSLVIYRYEGNLVGLFALSVVGLGELQSLQI